MQYSSMVMVGRRLNGGSLIVSGEMSWTVTFSSETGRQGIEVAMTQGAVFHDQNVLCYLSSGL